MCRRKSNYIISSSIITRKASKFHESISVCCPNPFQQQLKAIVMRTIHWNNNSRFNFSIKFSTKFNKLSFAALKCFNFSSFFMWFPYHAFLGLKSFCLREWFRVSVCLTFIELKQSKLPKVELCFCVGNNLNLEILIGDEPHASQLKNCVIL